MTTLREALGDLPLTESSVASSTDASGDLKESKESVKQVVAPASVSTRVLADGTYLFKRLPYYFLDVAVALPLNLYFQRLLLPAHSKEIPSTCPTATNNYVYCL